MNKKILLSIIFLLSGLNIYAHIPFLKPNQFRIYSNRFQIESTFTEKPFQADFAMHVPEFLMIKPDGQKEIIYPACKTKVAVYLTPEINQKGVYHFSTGVRVGPLYNAIEGDNERLYFAEEMKTAKGKKITMQYFSSADVYVSNGKSDYKPSILGNGVEIIPVSSPNELFLGGDIKVQVLKDGKYIPNARIVVVYNNEHYRFHRKGDLYDVDNVRTNNLHTDANGLVTFKPEYAGLVLLFVTIHERKNSNHWESHNASLTMEVQLP